MHPIAQEDIDYLVGGIDPDTGAGEAGMTIDGGGGIVGTGALALIGDIGLVET